MAASKRVLAMLLCCIVLLAATGIEAVKRGRGEGPSRQSERRVWRSPPPGPARMFLNTIESVVNGVLRAPRRIIGDSNQEIAEFVQQAILEQVQPDDPQKRAQLPNYGLEFSVVVWDARVRHPYEALINADTVIEGPSRAFVIRGGMTTNQQCYHRVVNEDPNSQKGWPCKGGGSVVVQAGSSPKDEKKCMVFFRKKDLPPFSREHFLSKVAMFQIVSKECQNKAGAYPKDLTNLAYCVFSEWGSDWVRQILKKEGSTRFKVGLKGVAVMPSYSVVSGSVGLVSPSGGLVMDYSDKFGEDLDGKGVRLILVGAPSNAQN